MQKETCDIGLIGLAVMGQNLVLNMNDHGYRVAVFNRTVSKVDDFLNNEAKGTQVVGAHSIAELVAGAEEAAPRDADGQGRRHGRPDDRPACAASRKGRHHHRRRQLALSGHQPPHQELWRRREFCSSAPAFPAARKARATARPSCPAAIPPPGRT